MRLIWIVVIFLIGIFANFNCIAADFQYQQSSVNNPGLIIKNKIEEIAQKKNLNDIQVNTAVDANGDYIVDISYKGISRKIILTRKEVAELLREESIKKINSVLEFFVNPKEPPPRSLNHE
ncbi:hypothetical protein AYO45_00580 [Gammaproteobacteria bacterium SCGC AG-212-F23]|nr:hypothetical protein AYO45_00580 [Gammaproteobacteria bacterium SCGC AG-212-F23]